MKFDMFDVVNYDRLGELLREWAKNEASRPPPGDIKDLEAAMNKAGVEVSFANHKYKTFEFITATKPGDTVLKIVLPPTEIIEAAATDLAKQDYQLPLFYADTFPGLAKVPGPMRETFHMQRIAEYVMKWCG